jgi:hypothetical protein
MSSNQPGEYQPEAAPQHGTPPYGAPQHGTPPYGAPPYGAPQYGAPPARKRKGPRILTFVGAGILVVGVVVGIFGVVGLAQNASGFIPTGIVAEDGGQGPDALAFTEVPGTASFEVTSAGGYLLYEVSSSAAGQLGASDVAVTGPDGPVDASVSGTSQQAELNGRNLRVLGAFTADQPGTYEIEVAPAAQVQDVAVAVGTPITDDAMEGLGAGALTALAGFVLGGLGFLLLLAGVIWWAVAGSRR